MQCTYNSGKSSIVICDHVALGSAAHPIKIIGAGEHSERPSCVLTQSREGLGECAGGVEDGGPGKDEGGHRYLPRVPCSLSAIHCLPLVSSSPSTVIRMECGKRFLVASQYRNRLYLSV
jgi:hypothetical protein